MLQRQQLLLLIPQSVVVVVVSGVRVPVHVPVRLLLVALLLLSLCWIDCHYYYSGTATTKNAASSTSTSRIVVYGFTPSIISSSSISSSSRTTIINNYYYTKKVISYKKQQYQNEDKNQQIFLLHQSSVSRLYFSSSSSSSAESYDSESSSNSTMISTTTTTTTISSSPTKSVLDTSINPITSIVKKGTIDGVSVSDNGLYVFLKIPEPFTIPTVTTPDSNTTINNDLSDSNESIVSNPSSYYKYIPIQVTDNSNTGSSNTNDKYEVTTPEGLTIIQLLSSVDMAGPIVPPELLSKIIVMMCEEGYIKLLEIQQQQQDQQIEQQNETLPTIQQQIVQSIQHQLYTIYKSASTSTTTTTTTTNKLQKEFYYIDEINNQNNWILSKIRYPTITLDYIELLYNTTTSTTNTNTSSSNNSSSFDYCNFILHCTVKSIDGIYLDSNNEDTTTTTTKSSKNNNKISINLNNYKDIIQDVSYQYTINNPIVSIGFISIALALRYKTSIQVTLVTNNANNDTTGSLYDPNNTANTSTPNNNFLLSYNELQDKYSIYYRTINQIQSQSNNVVQSIERSYYYNQLQAAYNIAIEKNDIVTAHKIQQTLSQYSINSIRQYIPVQSESDISSME